MWPREIEIIRTTLGHIQAVIVGATPELPHTYFN
jgi:hypothetical protein